MTRNVIQKLAPVFYAAGDKKLSIDFAIEISNASLSEAIEKMKVFYDSHYMGPKKDILEILEGLKIKP